MGIKPHSKAGKIWFGVFIGLFVLLITITLVITLNDLIYYTICSVIGGQKKYLKSGDPSTAIYYALGEDDPQNKAQARAAADAFNETVCEEGTVLLKNDDNALPLGTGARVTVFGRNSVDPVYGGSGSNAGSGGFSKMDLCDVLKNQGGMEFNDVIRKYYRGLNISRPSTPAMGSILTGFPIAEAPVSYPQTVKDSYKNYHDAAIVVFTRICGEGYDLPRTMFGSGKYDDWNAKRTPVSGASSADDHYLQLDKNEKDVLREACDNFEKVIVIINSASPLESDFLFDPVYGNKIKSALWIAYPGESGLSALGRILAGKVNPSGRTVDTYSLDYKNDPAWYNFGNNLTGNGNYYTYKGSEKASRFVEYREGIYVGYIYFETRGYTEALAGNAAWYAQNVAYPFGHGLSYTEFDHAVTPETASGSTVTANDTLRFTVNVENIGEYDGKEVVQLYYSAPYKDGIEKAHVNLGDFAKTEKLDKKIGKGTVTLEIAVKDMASYDCYDANGNGFKGYELESGEYRIYIGDNAHCWADPKFEFTYTVGDNVLLDGAENLFDDESAYIKDRILSRKNNFENFDVIKGVTEQREQSEYLRELLAKDMKDTADAPWYSATAPKQPKNSKASCSVKLYDLTGKDYDDPLWNELLDQLTFDEMTSLVETGNFRTLQLENIDKPLTIEADGPMGFALFMGDSSVYNTCKYACECLVGATFNRKIAYELGRHVGMEGLIGNEKGDGTPYSGWYAPAVNIHRSPFGGRNFEYYSEDGFLSGEMGKNVILGAKEYGVYCFVKHFALNDQETDRDNRGILTWADEQTMREIYFKPFEACVKDAKTSGMMSSFNRIGVNWAGSDHRLLTRLLRDEWGFEGTVITDFNVNAYMDPDDMLRGGGDINLAAGKSLSDTTSATAKTNLRRATKNILYTVANSCAMNGHGKGIVWGYRLPWWQTLFIVLDVVVGVLAAAWGAWVFIKRKPKNHTVVSPQDGEQSMTEAAEAQIVTPEELTACGAVENANDEGTATEPNDFANESVIDEN